MVQFENLWRCGHETLIKLVFIMHVFMTATFPQEVTFRNTSEELLSRFLTDQVVKV